MLQFRYNIRNWFEFKMNTFNSFQIIVLIEIYFHHNIQILSDIIKRLECFLRKTTIMMLCVFFVGNKKWVSEGLSQFFLLILSLIHSPNEILNSLPVPSSRHFPLHGTITFKVKKVLTYRFRSYTLLPIFLLLTLCKCPT